MTTKEYEFTSKHLLWMNHKLEGFYICAYERTGFLELFEQINNFKQDHFSILLSVLMSGAGPNMSLKIFSQSSSLAVWYDLDKEIFK